ARERQNRASPAAHVIVELSPRDSPSQKPLPVSELRVTSDFGTNGTVRAIGSGGYGSCCGFDAAGGTQFSGRAWRTPARRPGKRRHDRAALSEPAADGGAVVRMRAARA